MSDRSGRDFRGLFAPRAVAVIGASQNPSKLSGRLIRNLLRPSFHGAVYPINPNRETIAGTRCYRDLLELPTVPDLVVLAVPAADSPVYLEACGQAGVSYVMMIASGFAEAPPEGEDLQRECVAIARRHGFGIVGPNSQSVVSVPAGMMCGFGTSLSMMEFREGPISIVSQSGGLGVSAAARGQKRGLGHNAIVSSGNQADLDLVDFVEAFLDDDRTEVIGIYAEGIARGVEFGAAARRALRQRTPIVLLCAGRTEEGRRAAASHTASLSAGHQILNGVCEQLGVTMADDLDDFTDYCAVFSARRLVSGRRIGVITTSGGLGVVMSDRLAERGFMLPQPSLATVETLRRHLPGYVSVANPVDLTGAAVSDLVLRIEAFRAVHADPNYDATVVINGQLQGADAEAFAAELVAQSAATEKPLLVIWSAPGDSVGNAYDALSVAGIPRFDLPTHGAKALEALAKYSEVYRDARHWPAEETGSQDTVSTAPVSSIGLLTSRTGLTEYQAKQLAGMFGIRGTREVEIRSASEAVAAAQLIGYPIAAKVSSALVSHKTEIAGVELNLKDDDSLALAVMRLLKTGSALDENAGVLIAEMVDDAVFELIAGALVHPEFGPAVMVGSGGIHAEMFHDVIFLQAPVTAAQAERALRKLMCWQLLEGVRGRPAGDRVAVIDLLVRLSQMITSLRSHVSSIDLNPVFVLPAGRGVTVGDALVQRAADRAVELQQR
jgi:acetate---CoA ligase (ADP-forming)